MQALIRAAAVGALILAGTTGAAKIGRAHV
jgi:outer membrane murein-binding lipoprotein Lpp